MSNRNKEELYEEGSEVPQQIRSRTEQSDRKQSNSEHVRKRDTAFPGAPNQINFISTTHSFER